MTRTRPYVIVGASLAGAKAAQALRENGFAVHEEQWYTDNGVELLLGRRATGLDRAANEVELEDRERISYANYCSLPARHRVDSTCLAETSTACTTCAESRLHQVAGGDPRRRGGGRGGCRLDRAGDRGRSTPVRLRGNGHRAERDTAAGRTRHGDGRSVRPVASPSPSTRRSRTERAVWGRRLNPTGTEVVYSASLYRELTTTVGP